MLFPNVASRVEQLVQLYYTVNDRLRHLEEDMRRIKDEGRETNREVADLKTRIAVLEETVRSLRAEMRSELRAVAAETVADLRVRFIEEQTRPSQPPAGCITQNLPLQSSPRRRRGIRRGATGYFHKHLPQWQVLRHAPSCTRPARSFISAR